MHAWKIKAPADARLRELGRPREWEFMKRASSARRRPAVHITLSRAARLHRLVRILSGGSKGRDALLDELEIGLRTFYRELELLQKCGIKIRLEQKFYVLKTTAEDAEGRLPFPDPQLSFADMAELARLPGEVASRLAALLASVVGGSGTTSKRKKSGRAKKG